MDDTDTRKPFDCSVMLARWKSGERSWSVVMQMRTFRFLEYPQANPAAFKELCKLCEDWASQTSMVEPNPNQAGLEALSEELLNNKVASPSPVPIGKFWFGLFWLVVGWAVMLIAAVLYVLYSFLTQGNILG